MLKEEKRKTRDLHQAPADYLLIRTLHANQQLPDGTRSLTIAS